MELVYLYKDNQGKTLIRHLKLYDLTDRLIPDPTRRCQLYEAAKVLSDAGLSVSDAFRLLLLQCAIGKSVVFELLIPISKSISPMEGSREGRVYGFDSIEELIEELNASALFNLAVKISLDGKTSQSLVVFLSIPSGNKSSTCW